MKWKFGLQFLRNEDDGGGGGGGGSTPPGSIIQDPGKGGDKPWYNDLPDDLKSHAYVAQTKDLTSFVKSAIDTKSMVGANVIKLPGEKATPEERAAFYKQLGRPDDLKGYEPTVKPVNESIVDPAIQDRMKTVFLENGLTKAQGQAILDAYTGVLNEGYTKHTETLSVRHEEGVTALKQEWGTNYDANVKTAQLAVRELGGETLFQKIVDAGLGSDPEFLKFLHNTGTRLLDDDARGEGGGQFGGSSEGALAEINRLKTDAEFMSAFTNARHAGHGAAVQKWEQLHRQAYPGKQKESDG